MCKDISYDIFKDTLLAYNKQLAQESKRLNALLGGHKLSNGFVPKAVMDSIEGFEEQYYKYLTLSSVRFRFLDTVPLKTRKKYLRQMAKERSPWR